MKPNKKDLIAYAQAFVSFVIPKIEADEIVLFGSAARGEATAESDIDIFFNVKTKEKGIKKTLQEQLTKFHKSYTNEQFRLKGIKNRIVIEAGNLDKWKLKRSIISEGIVLYGKYKETPKDLKGFTLFTLKPIKNVTKRNRVIRKLFGRKEKKYVSKGIIAELGGNQLSPTAFIIPLSKSQEIIKMFNAEKVDYTLIEFWSDQISK